MKNWLIILPLSSAIFTACNQQTATEGNTEILTLNPVFVTDTVPHDSDDPAIWINRLDPSKSIIIGTDKDQDGGLYVFDLAGKMIDSLTVTGLQRPNNVDLAYDLAVGDTLVDIAVTTERAAHNLRVFSLPDMKPLDNGGLPMFEGETQAEFRDLMGIALYTKAPGEIYAIVGRKTGPTEGGYLWQYLLKGDSLGHVTATLVRKFGKFSGKKEIESIAVDNELGYVYYSDEGVGVRKYYADPAKGDEELALFATTGFTQDHEGISIYKVDETTGYILVSDQQANNFHIFPREGANGQPHEHPLIKVVHMSTDESDGSDVISVPLNDQFKHGLFVAMSTDKTFQYYRWEDIAGEDLKLSNSSASDHHAHH